jgi:ribosomal protein L37AE/L43A
MGNEQYNIKKDCPKCECHMVRMLSHPMFHCFYCGHDEEDAEK